MNKGTVIVASIFITLSIIFGAFGTHGLEGKISDHGIDVWNTAAEYQMYAGLGLLIIGLSADKFSFKLKWIILCSTIGSIIFSGLLYLVALQDLNAGLKILGAFVPIGGSLMIFAWILLIFKLIKASK